MGIRLYVNGNEEIITEVPVGTAAKLDVIQARRPTSGDNRELMKWHDEIDADPAVDRLHCFRLFGFGRLGDAEYDYIESQGKDTCSDRMDQPEQVAKMLELHGVSLPENAGVTSVYWG